MENKLHLQTDIFEFLNDEQPQASKKIGVGSKVRMIFHKSEASYVKEQKPYLLGVGEIIGQKLDFFTVQFDNECVEVDKRKLKLV